MESCSATDSVPQVASFNEEHCRDLLQDIGERIVRFYPFTVGIEEVYTLLLESYGEDSLADALGVLHELMEGDDNASGLGDDGDIWRSWRHSWRHRNDNPSRPFTPMVNGLVLPSPTLHSRRQARAASSSSWAAATLEAYGQLSGQSETNIPDNSKSSLLRSVHIHGSHNDPPQHGQRNSNTEDSSARSCEVDSDMEEADSQQAFDEVQHLTRAVDFGSPELISFEMLNSPANLRGSDNSVRYLRPVRTAHKREDFLTPVEHESAPGCWRLANRNARVIDSAVYTVKHDDCTYQSPLVRRNSDVWETRSSDVRASWFRAWQKEPHRRSLSFLQSMRGAFTDHRQPQPQHLEDHNRHEQVSSSPHNALDRGCDMLPLTSTVASTLPITSVTPHTQGHAQELDGTFDAQPSWPTLSLDLNKALPANPANSGDRTLSSSRTGTPSLDQSQGTSVRPPTASSVSSAVSHASSKRDFRALTRGLLDEDMSVRRPDLSPVCEINTLPSKTYNPRDSTQSSVYSENSHKGTTFHNLAGEDPAWLNTAMPLPLSARKRDNVGMSPEQARMSPPQSLPNAQAYSPSKQRHDNTVHGFVPLSQDDDNTGEIGFEPATTPRGRTPYRPSSPNHTGQVPNARMRPQKRSRSPIKKFLGHFGKSTSLMDLASEPQSNSNSSSPEKSTMTPVKSWGTRFRHGFLTSDSEIDEQPHDTSSQSRKVTSNTPQHSTFPISLDPPYQARMLAELELMICYHANNFLMEQWTAGRLSDHSIAKIKHTWTARNRAQVLEFMYDQATQRDLIAANLRTIDFHGDCGQSPHVLNATLYSWRSMATEMAVRTFCSADSAIKKYLHDSHKIIEMLGAPPHAFFALQEMQIRTLTKITQKQRERMQRNKEQQTPSKPSGSVGKRVGTPAPTFGHTPKSGSLGSRVGTPAPMFNFGHTQNSRSMDVKPTWHSGQPSKHT